MGHKCTEQTEATAQALTTHKAIKFSRWIQRRNRALTSMGWRYHL